MGDYDDEAPLVLFDGVCGMCNRCVVAMLRRDKRGVLRFASNTSPFGVKILEQFDARRESAHSIMVVDKGRLLKKSDAVFCICSHLGSPYALMGIFKVVPRVVRDAVYDLVARYRYKFFGKVEECQLIPPELRRRIISDEGTV